MYSPLFVLLGNADFMASSRGFTEYLYLRSPPWSSKWIRCKENRPRYGRLFGYSDKILEYMMKQALEERS